eukprot:g17193.t1
MGVQALAHALNDALARAAANRETRLEALALEDCQVGEEGAKALAEHLPKSALMALSVARGGLIDDDATALLLALPKSIAFLDLSGNQLSDLTASIAGETLYKRPGMSINLAANHLSPTIKMLLGEEHGTRLRGVSDSAAAHMFYSHAPDNRTFLLISMPRTALLLLALLSAHGLEESIAADGSVAGLDSSSFLQKPAQGKDNGTALGPAPHIIGLRRESVPIYRRGKIASFKTSYSGVLSVGYPPQDFRVVFDTGSAHIILPASECQSEACLANNRRHYDQNLSAKWENMACACIRGDSKFEPFLRWEAIRAGA